MQRKDVAVGHAIESLVFVGVHVKYGQIPPMILSGALGLLMAFIATAGWS